MIRVKFRVGTLKLKDDTGRLERAVDGIRTSTREGMIRLREYEAAQRRLRDALLSAVTRALGG